MKGFFFAAGRRVALPNDNFLVSERRAALPYEVIWQPYFLLTAENGYGEMYSFRRSHFQM